MPALSREVAVVFLIACTKQPTPAPSAVVSASAPSIASSTAPVVSASAAPAEAGAPKDSIARLVAKLEKQPMWTNGGFPKIALPETEKLDKVVTAALDRISFDKGKATRHTILDSRTVTIAPDTHDYTAVLLDTDQGRKIMLLQWQGSVTGWWSRVFDE